MLGYVAKLISLVFNVRLRHNAISVEAKAPAVLVVRRKHPVCSYYHDRWLGNYRLNFVLALDNLSVCPTIFKFFLLNIDPKSQVRVGTTARHSKKYTYRSEHNHHNNYYGNKRI